MIDRLKENWDAIKDTLKENYDISKVSYDTWIVPMEIHNDILKILLPPKLSFPQDHKRIAG